MTHRDLISGLAAAAILLWSYGCAAVLLGAAGAAAGAGTVVYMSGELRATEDVTLDRAWDAAQGAMGAYGYAITSEEKGSFEAGLTAEGENDKTVKIKLKKLTDRSTKIGIRVGTFGDETISRQILEEMKKRF